MSVAPKNLMSHLALVISAFFVCAATASSIPLEIATLLPSAPSPLLSSLHDYELVSIDSTYSTSRQLLSTTSTNAYPDQFSLNFIFNEQHIRANLSLNAKLFANGYREERQVWRDGKRYPEEELPVSRPKLCHYQGPMQAVVDISSSSAEIMSTDGDKQASSGTISAHTPDPHVRTHSLSADTHNTIVDGLAAVSTCSELLPPHIQGNTILARAGISYFSGSLIFPDRVLAIVPAITVLDKLTLEKQLSKLTKRNLQRLRSRSPASSSSPSSLSISSLYVVYDVAQLQEAESGTCGVSHEHSSPHIHMHAHTHTHAHAHVHTPASSPIVPAATQYYIEIHIANDVARYTANSASVTTTEASTASIVNLMDAIYQTGGLTANVRVALSGQTTFTVQNPWSLPLGTCDTCNSGEIDSSELLRKWTSHASAQSIAGDIRHVLSGEDFDGNVLGLAYVGGACQSNANTGVVQTRTGSNVYIATILSHESAHNLNIDGHDGLGAYAACASNAYIMGTTMLNPPAQTFSPCSATVIDAFLASKACFLNVPDGWEDSTPTCGDGVVQSGEDCDCGSADCSGIDACCNGSSCQFASGATCAAHNACCDTQTCQPATAGTLCRAAVGQCDAPETCDGSLRDCPADGFKGAGAACTDDYGTGLCWRGTCSSLQRQCSVGTSEFMGSPFDACDAGVLTDNNGGNFCGTLLCAISPSNPEKCQAFPSGSSFIRVSDGVPCGVDTSNPLQPQSQQCYLGTCRHSSDLATLAGTYVYSTSAWSTCYTCDEIQTRSASCVVKATNKSVDASLCGAMPVTRQYCVNALVGCTGKGEISPLSDSGSDGVIFFGKEFPKTWFIVVSAISGLALLAFSWWMGIALTKGAHSQEAKEDLLKFMRRGFARRDTHE